MDIISIIIADDHVIFRKGLRIILNEINDVKVVGEASNGNELLEEMKKNPADVVLMDVNMPVLDGIEATRRLTAKYPDTKVIALTMHEEIGYFHKMVEAGADGFLLKKTNKDELEKAIQLVASGDHYFSEEFMSIATKYFNLSENKTDIKLSERELEVLDMICKGHNNSEISRLLGLSQRTVDGHRAKLLEKTGTKNAPHLVMYAIRNGLIRT